jgi:hypothetical protein
MHHLLGIPERRNGILILLLIKEINDLLECRPVPIPRSFLMRLID